MYLDSIIVEVKNPADISIDKGSNVFSEETLLRATPYVPQGASAAYAEYAPWKSFKTIVEMQNNTKKDLSWDLNNDGEVNIADALMIINRVVSEKK